MERRIGLLLWSAATLLSLATIAMAQTPLSKILGTVKDASGAVVPSASVTVTNESTGFRRTVLTDQEGYYEADRIPDGPYSVQATKPGFKSFANEHVPLAIRQAMRIDVTLELGQVADRVSVDAEAPVITTDSTQIASYNFNRKVLNNSYFNYYQMFFGDAQYLSPSIQLYHVVGTIAAQNRPTVDGLEVSGNTYFYTDQLQDVQILAGGTTAEYSQPMVADFIVQSGTNDFHGRFLVQLDNPALNALGPNATKRGAGYPTNKQYFFSVSGPVRLPKIYNGTDKTFFYVSRMSINQTALTRQEQRLYKFSPDAMRTGDFSFLPASSFTNGVLLNPYTRQPFPNNQIPTAMFSQVAANVQNLFPASNNPHDPYFTGNNYVRPTSDPQVVTDAYNWSIKIDHQLTSRDRVGFGTQLLTSDVISDPSGNESIWSETVGHPRNYRAYWTHIFSPHMVNEFRSGIERNPSVTGFDPTPPVGQTLYGGDGAAFMRAMGITQIPSVDELRRLTLPSINISGYHGINSSGGQDVVVSPSNTLIDRRHFTDNLNWVRGSHTLKLGGDLRMALNATVSWDPSVMARLDFSGRFTGHPYGDFLLGIPDNTYRTGVLPRPYQKQKWGGALYSGWLAGLPSAKSRIGLTIRASEHTI